MTARPLSFLVALAASLLLACGPVGAQEVTPAEGPSAGDSADVDPSDWPREIDAPNAAIVVYQPQLDTYEGGVLGAHSAVAVTRTGETEPVFGAVWFTARMETDREARVCRLYDVRVPRARFPGCAAADEAALTDVIRREVPGWVHPISMDRLLPAIEALEQERAIDERLAHDPPRVLVETVPALLVPIDGEAKLVPVLGSRIQRVANTPVALLFEPTTRTWWIDGGAAWIYATSVDGPYRTAEAAPAEIAAVRTSNDDDERETADRGAAPKVVVAHEPAELLAFDGEPRWEPIVGEELRYASNTTSAVFLTPSDSRVYAILSGRWYRTTSLRAGPWEFVRPDALPSCFAKIPEDSPIGGVLAHVPGTELAAEAVADARVPQTAAIRRATARCSVVYDGEPRFDPVPGTDLRYAVNTASQVLLYRDRYYCCDQGVWFVALTPTGPWAVADDVPAAFQQIPPECPVYNTKYVYVVDTTPEVVYVAATPGYYGWYAWGGTVVWGTGWRYPCWHGSAWYPRLSTWSVSVAFNPWWGAWHQGVAFHSHGGWSVGIGRFAGWGHGGTWWGPCGYRPWRPRVAYLPYAHRPRHDRFVHDGRRAPPVNVYVVPRNLGRNAPDRLGGRRVSTPGFRVAPPAAAPPAPPRQDARRHGDVFADRDGSVFRRDGESRWESREGRTWRPAPVAPRPAAPRVTPPPPARTPPRTFERPPLRPAPTPSLQRDAWVRDRGGMRGQGGARDRGGAGGRGGRGHR